MMPSLDANNFPVPGLASLLLLSSAMVVGCSMPNPAFSVSVSATETGTTTMQESTQGPTGASTSDPTEASTDPTMSTETTAGPTTSSTTEDDTTTDSTDSETSSETEPETTEDPCPDCVSDEPVCADAYTVLMCENQCLDIKLCTENTLCWMWEGSAACEEFTADCIDFADQYHNLLQENKSCINNESCQALPGHCQMAGGKCFEVVNLDVTAVEINEIADGWKDLGCDKEPGVGCMTCEGLNPPTVICDNGTCVAEM